MFDICKSAKWHIHPRGSTLGELTPREGIGKEMSQRKSTALIAKNGGAISTLSFGSAGGGVHSGFIQRLFICILVQHIVITEMLLAVIMHII